MNSKRCTKLVREGRYAAEVDVDLLEFDDGWSARISLDDARKLDEVRKALRRNDVDAANKLGRVFQLMPVSA